MWPLASKGKSVGPRVGRPGSLSQTAPQGEVSPLPCIRAGGLEHHPTVTPTPPTRKLEDQGSLWFSERGAL